MPAIYPNESTCPPMSTSAILRRENCLTPRCCRWRTMGPRAMHSQVYRCPESHIRILRAGDPGVAEGDLVPSAAVQRYTLWVLAESLRDQRADHELPKRTAKAAEAVSRWITSVFFVSTLSSSLDPARKLRKMRSPTRVVRRISIGDSLDGYGGCSMPCYVKSRAPWYGERAEPRQLSLETRRLCPRKEDAVSCMLRTAFMPGTGGGWADTDSAPAACGKSP